MSGATITQEMSVPEVVQRYPATDEVFRRFGIHAAGYKALDHENLFATARVHQINLDELLAALNKAVG